MARYIDADKLYRRVKEKTNPYGKPTLDYESGVKVLDMIENAPTANIAEVKHGEWKDKYGGKYHNKLYVCSLCGEKALHGYYMNELYQVKDRQVLTDYCPQCGAKMKEGEKW